MRSVLNSRRAPHGARGLKPKPPIKAFEHDGRAPHGARGLKREFDKILRAPSRSRPARGAWIETEYFVVSGR